MKIPTLNPHYRASLVLILAAAILVALAILTNDRDIPPAAVVLSAVICLITGIFFATLAGPEPLDHRFVGLLPVGGSISLARTAAGLGIAGNAVVLPKETDGRGQTIQFNPVASYDGGEVRGQSFVAGGDACGLITVPAGGPLLAELQQNNQFAIPGDTAALADLIRETAVDLLEVADKARVEQGDGTITVSMEGYRLISGCRALAAESPRICSTHPCPVCSLYACILAEGLGRAVQVERCGADDEGPTVTASFSLLP